MILLITAAGNLSVGIRCLCGGSVSGTPNQRKADCLCQQLREGTGIHANLYPNRPYRLIRKVRVSLPQGYRELWQ